MPDDLTPEAIERATFEGTRRALEDHADRERIDPMGRLRQAFSEADDPDSVRRARRNKPAGTEGGEDGDGDDE